MGKLDKPMLKILSGQPAEHVPIWLMRQAGRYLPEYRTLRAEAKHFLNMCLTPQWASEITLQPLKRFPLDAAIIFADILLVPMALGVGLEFREGEGPVLERLEDEAALMRLRFDSSRVQPVYEALGRVYDQLPGKTALIGFCGAPWTVACYMIDGTSKAGFARAKDWAAHKPEALDRLIDILVDASVGYLVAQVKAGAEILQIFDSWSGLLHGDDFRRFVITPTKELVQRVKAQCPDVPIIGFPREAGAGYHAYIRETGVDALSLDPSVDLALAKQDLQAVKPLQGNLDPALLVQGGEAMLAAAEKILQALGPQHIFNLGHGVVPQTPPDHVAQLVDYVHRRKTA